MLADIYRDEWDVDELSKSQILEETRAIFGKAIDKGVPRSTSHRTAFKERLKTSTDVFSAFRVHTQAQHMAELMTDEDGNRLPFREWAERVQPYVNHQNRAWLRTEFDTATRRAHNEADWQRFQEEADIYPNLEWVPSTSANPGQDHQPFWGTVLPINDPFWNEHKPGDRWNCKCSLRSTDKAPTHTPSASGKHYDPAPGLNTRPGSGEIFSDDHAYYPRTCGDCPFAGSLRALFSDLARRKGNCNQCQAVRKVVDTEKTELIKQRKQEYKAYKSNSNYIDVAFDNKTGGLKATHKEHNFDSNATRKEYEPSVRDIGYKDGNKVILEKEDHTKHGVRNTEGFWNDKPFEIAARESGTPNNIRDGLKHCAKKPKCKVAVLYYPKNNFSINAFEEGLAKYNGLKGTSQWTQFDEIVCIQADGKIYKKTAD